MLFFILCFAVLIPVEGATKKQKAKKAFREAIESGEITVNDRAYSALRDANRDGYPELIIFDYEGCDPLMRIYRYKKGKAKLIVTHNCEWMMFYNASERTFHERGEGSGGWRIDYKLKGNTLTQVCRYYGYSTWDGKSGYTKTVNGKEITITKEEYTKRFEEAPVGNVLKQRTKAKLLKLLS